MDCMVGLCDVAATNMAFAAWRLAAKPGCLRYSHWGQGMIEETCEKTDDSIILIVYLSLR